jgi:signal transduction histidine kinase
VRRLARAFNLMAARVQAHEEQRRTLLADITHELRTPLAVIQGNLEALIDGVHPRDDAHLTPVLDEARVLSTLVEDLRTLALAETGALQLHCEPVDLDALLQDIVAAFGAQAQAASVAITLDCAPRLPVLNGDPTRIRQVVSNLLTNALRHTPPGGSIDITACVAGGEARTEVTVTVRDTGQGIAQADLPRIFDRFYKSGDSRGSGLGLPIAQNLVALHGGQITAESAAGRGTTIRFTLPVRRPD